MYVGFFCVIYECLSECVCEILPELQLDSTKSKSLIFNLHRSSCGMFTDQSDPHLKPQSQFKFRALTSRPNSWEFTMCVCVCVPQFTKTHSVCLCVILFSSLYIYVYMCLNMLVSLYVYVYIHAHTTIHFTYKHTYEQSFMYLVCTVYLRVCVCVRLCELQT